MYDDEFKFYDIVDLMVDNNPLYQVFYGTYAIGFTFAVVLFAGVLTALVKRQVLVGTMLSALTVTTTLAAIDLAVDSNFVFGPLLQWIVVATMVALTGYLAYRASTSLSLKLIQITACLLMASLAATFATSLTVDFYRVSSTDWGFWANVDSYFWLTDFVLMAGLLVQVFVYAYKRLRDTRNQSDLADDRTFGSPWQPNTGTEGR